MQQLAAHKEQARATWGMGDYDAMMRQEGLYGVGQRLVQRLGIRPGEAVLDVACGTGNAAIPAAQAGARVTGVDLSPEMLDVGRRRADAIGVEVEWRDADAEQLPWDDGSFDVVLSTFGAMFAPRHEVVADEIARMLRRDTGRMGICSWTPEGVFGDFFRTVAAYLPPDPEFVDPPLRWGEEAHVHELFEGTDVQLEFDRDHWEITHDSAEAAVECYTTRLGPVIQARRFADTEGRWAQLRDDLARLFAEHRTRDADDVRFEAESLVVVGRRSP